MANVKPNWCKFLTIRGRGNQKNPLQNKTIGKKSVKPGINSFFPQMPSIVPCLDKASKSGWKMGAPFLSVWNYYPFVLSLPLLSSSSRVCVFVCVHTKQPAMVRS